MSLHINGVALVTGAGSGIGRECALAYAAEGARGVVVADLRLEAAQETARECEAAAGSREGFKALAVAVDVGSRESVDAMVRSAVDAFGRIDYLVNSAGVGVQRHLPVDDADAAEMERFWRVNVMGSFNCIQAVTKVMKVQDVATVVTRTGRVREVGRGVILNIGSCNSYMATPHIVQYTTTKHAVMGLTKNAALDNAAYGIRVNAICPGWVETPMVDAAMEGNPELPKMMKTVIPMARIAKPEEIADVVLFMTSPRSSYVTGVGWIVDGGTTLQVQAC
ncbi:hypothetical protein GGS23DRAFT_555044 [Durotheca rogersii]|uniref:uncharacterized protein n=1 Tax=Durotheca rogersii TaxID=419775 RepID=UPI00221E4DBD|nr:uncharacterized protein GGS23DRAFT_555044 [Durotheca rogersii]KAI5866013.1 hypothetical protein GGS23DRAFT_555044 [Durotheca rogersii]